jgi:hypothetical protein
MISCVLIDSFCLQALRNPITGMTEKLLMWVNRITVEATLRESAAILVIGG